MATGDIRIDSLLALPRDSLARNLPIGKAVEITYSFSGYSVAQASAISSMLAEISTQIGVSFRQVEQGALIIYGFKTGGPTLADGSPSTGSMEIKADGSGAMVWLNPTVTAMQKLDSGYGRQVALHETAHALGLKHPGEYSSYDTGPYLPIASATANHTIMAYNGGSTEHLGDYDLLALQYLYGPPISAEPPKVAVDVLSTYTTGSYFNDTIRLDVNIFAAPARADGLAGTDVLVINVASSNVTLKSGLKEFTYTKPDGGLSVIALDNIERVTFTDKTLALDVGGIAGQAFRLYKAAFDRAPDKAGLGYWINQMDKGSSLGTVAAGFVSSNEFIALNGASPSSTNLTTSLYQHVLGRGPDPVGLSYWVSKLDDSLMNRADVLMGFSESNENHIATSGQIQNGIEYTPVS